MAEGRAAEGAAKGRPELGAEEGRCEAHRRLLRAGDPRACPDRRELHSGGLPAARSTQEVLRTTPTSFHICILCNAVQQTLYIKLHDARGGLRVSRQAAHGQCNAMEMQQVSSALLGAVEECVLQCVLGPVGETCCGARSMAAEGGCDVVPACKGAEGGLSRGDSVGASRAATHGGRAVPGGQTTQVQGGCRWRR